MLWSLLLGASSYFSTRYGFNSHCLLNEAIEELASGAGLPPVKSKCELVQVVVQMGGLNSAVVSPQQPSLEQ